MKLHHNYTYPAALAVSERIGWRVEDILGGEKRLDFRHRFLPEALARVEPLEFLREDERRILNQVRAHEYLATFGLVEEFILPFVLDHARARLRGDDARTRAFLQFAGEEAKHIDLFKRFRKAFESGFGRPCRVIGPPEAVAEKVLSHHPLAVTLTILHIEWMTQRHYLESVRDDGGLDPVFRSLLKHHWMEEAQHAKLDTLMLEAIAETCSKEEIGAAFEEYLEIGGFLDAGLRQQVDFDLEDFEEAIGRTLPPAERERALEVQRKAVRWTYLGSGMSHPNFLASVEALDPGLRARAERAALAFS